MSQAKVLHFRGIPLLIWLRGSEQLLESQQLARLLGYVQVGSIRKQVMSDWKEEFLHDEDYILIRGQQEEEELLSYESLEVLHTGNCKPAKLERGRMFLTKEGLKKVLEKSTKTTSELEAFFQAHLFDDDTLELDPSPAPLRSQDIPKPFQGPFQHMFPVREMSSTFGTPSPGAAQGESKTRYDVIQQLLHNLKEHQERELRELAIEAAEIMLERRLDDIRKKFLDQEKPQAPPRKTEGPVFEQEGWYGCKQIGEMAGGYSSTTSGKAATIVGERWGYTAQQIRKKQLPFNKLVEAPDTNGRLRPQFRFNRAFSNEVILELRNNPHLAPMQEIPAQLELESSPRRYPKLSKGPFDEEEEELSPHMENFLETLQPKH